MYNPTHFTVTDTAQLHALVRQFPLGMLVTHSGGALDANHLPFELLTNDSGETTLIAHVARANPVWQQLAQGEAVMVVFRAEDGYISPNWYPSKHENHRQVPTWNYRVVHAHGTVAVRDDEKFVRGVVARLTRTHEARTQARGAQAHPAWKMGDAPSDYVQQMLGAIVGLEITVTRLEGKYKLSQNRTAADAQGAMAGLEGVGDAALAQQMQQAYPA